MLVAGATLHQPAAEAAVNPPSVAHAAPVSPLRAAPTYVRNARWYVPNTATPGHYLYVGLFDLPAAARPFYGDWDGDGTFTPGWFRNGAWTLYATMVGSSQTTSPLTFTYGTVGDLPAVGDWNGDGRTDVAVFRRGAWHLRDAVLGRSVRTFAYGTAGDLPLAGDWNGDGRASIGVRRGSVFHLADDGAVPRTAHRFPYGYATDWPMAADWDGDGRDSIGVVRGATWYTQSDVATRRTSASTIVRPSGTVPVPYPSPTGPGGDACPTASPSFTSPASHVVPPPPLTGDMPASGDEYDALQDAQRYLLGTRFSQRYGSVQNQRYLNLRAGHTAEEHSLRPVGMAALTIAVGVSMDGFDPARVGHTREIAVTHLDWTLRSMACQHRSVSPGGWGRSWQSDLWAQYAGLAAWLVWGELSPQTQAYVAAMLVYEADYKASTPVAYWMNRSGVFDPGRSGNSAAEEMGWEAATLGIAAQVMPGHPNAQLWLRKGTQKAIAAWSSLADTTSPTVVNGVPLGARLNGANIREDGLVVNHGMVHPDYTSAASMVWTAAWPAMLRGGTLPEGYTHNSRLVWVAMSQRRYEYQGDQVSIYRSDGTLNYIGGPGDWGEQRFATYVKFDAAAHLVGADRDAATGGQDSPTAREWMATHLSKVRELQTRSTDGHMYDPTAVPAEFSYYSNEELSAEDLAGTWAIRYAEQFGGPLNLSTERLDP